MEAQAILALISAIVAAAPTIEIGVKKAKDLVSALFTAKIITAEVQSALFAVVESRAKLAKAGPPIAWTVEPDPVI